MENASYYRSEQLEIIHLKNKPFTYSEHNHISVYTIGLVLHGEITLKTGRQYSAYTAPSFFIVAPYQTHALVLQSDYDMLSVCINKNLLLSYHPYELFGVLSQILPQLSQDIDYALLVEALDAMYACEAPQPTDNVILSSALSLEYSPENDGSLQAMADQTNYSLYHYIKVFKQHIGLTPHKFQIQNKIRKAQRMIECGDMSTDIALELGFYDQSHFIKCFKNVVGLTPTQYRSAVQQI